MALAGVGQFMKGPSSVLNANGRKFESIPSRGNFSAELHLAESAKRQLQQLETSVNAANQGSIDVTAEDVNPTVTFTLSASKAYI